VNGTKQLFFPVIGRGGTLAHLFNNQSLFKATVTRLLDFQTHPARLCRFFGPKVGKVMETRSLRWPRGAKDNTGFKKTNEKNPHNG